MRRFGIDVLLLATVLFSTAVFCIAGYIAYSFARFQLFAFESGWRIYWANTTILFVTLLVFGLLTPAAAGIWSARKLTRRMAERKHV